MAALTGMRPMLEVDDMRATINFWRDALGFSVTASMGEDPESPGWCNLSRDGVSIMFTWEPEHSHGDGSSHKSEARLGGSLYINVDDVDTLFEELRAGGQVGSISEPKTQAHGMREIAVEDPNGFFVFFGQPV